MHEETNTGNRDINQEAINKGDTKFSGLSASGYYDAIYQKEVRQEEKQAWAAGHVEFRLALGHAMQKETFRIKQDVWGPKLRKENLTNSTDLRTVDIWMT